MQSQKQQQDYRDQSQSQWEDSRFENMAGNRGVEGENEGGTNTNTDSNQYSQPYRERASSQPSGPTTEYSQPTGNRPMGTGIMRTANPSSPEYSHSRSPSLSPEIRFTQAPSVSTPPSSSTGFHNPWVTSQSRSRIPSFGRTTSHPGGSGNNKASTGGINVGVSGAGGGGGISSSGLGFFPHAVPVPMRSSSFSAPSGSSVSGSSYLSAVRDSLRFTSTFEDDESEALSDNSYSFEDISGNAGANGNRRYPQPSQYGTDVARSRSQSLLVPPSPGSAEFGASWRDRERDAFTTGSTTATARPSFSSSDFLTPGAAAAPTNIPGRSRTQAADISNISPFRRDLHQILMGDTATLGSHSVGGIGGHHYGKQGGGIGGLGTLGPPGAPSVSVLGLGMLGHREDPLGGTSGTTSRRHSMSIYHPRRDIHVGFQTSSTSTVGNNIGSSAFEDAAVSSSSNNVALTPLFRSNVLSDDELASGLGGGVGGITSGLQSFTMSASAPGHAGMQSQPSSLPNFTGTGASGLLGSLEHSRFLSGGTGTSPGAASARGLSPHRPSISPTLSRTTTTSSSHLDTASDRATSVSPRNDVVAGSTSFGLGGTNAMGISIGMAHGSNQHHSYGRHGFAVPPNEMEYSGVGVAPLSSESGSKPGRYLPNALHTPASLSMYSGVPDSRLKGSAQVGVFAQQQQQQQPTSPVTFGGPTPTRFGHAHSASMGSLIRGGIPSINATMGGVGGGNNGGSGGGGLHQLQAISTMGIGMGRGGIGLGISGPTSPHSLSSPTSGSDNDLNELGKGMPLHSVPHSYQLFIVEFKAGRTDLFYTTDRSSDIRLGDLVIVEADRGKDLGKIINDTITTDDVEAFQRAQQQSQAQQIQMDAQFGGEGGGNVGKREINPKRIYGKAGQQDTLHLTQKMQDEMKALQLCQTKVRAKKLPMEVVDAEYQWDRRKLTFYFVAEKRIDFRELVRELFRLYKTRIWMASLQAPHEPVAY